MSELMGLAIGVFIILTLFVIHGLAEIRDELRKLNKKGD